MADPNAPFPVLPHPPLDNTLGALYVGLLVSTALFGLTTLQTYWYYVNYPKDRAALKWLVATLWVLDFAHTIVIAHSGYYFLVIQYGNLNSLLRGDWSIISEVALTIPVTFLVQVFFAHRVYNLSHKNWLLAGLVLLLACAQSGLGIYSCVRLFQIQFFSRLHSILGAMSATLILMAVNDAIITVALCWNLYRSRKTSSFSETRSLVKLLIQYTIETNLVTSVFAIIDGISILVMPTNWVFIALTFCVSKLYANSLLTILNSRRTLKNVVNGVTISSGPQYNTNGSKNPSSPSRVIRMQDMSFAEAAHAHHFKTTEGGISVTSELASFNMELAESSPVSVSDAASGISGRHLRPKSQSVGHGMENGVYVHREVVRSMF